jgi:NAD(P)-dependent dehydrogenase (short-subunit alcohol dehydrogenase family)
MSWSAADIPDLSGKVFIVTGGNTGLGFETARELAAHKAHVIIMTRSMERGAKYATVLSVPAQVRWKKEY